MVPCERIILSGIVFSELTHQVYTNNSFQIKLINVIQGKYSETAQEGLCILKTNGISVQSLEPSVCIVFGILNLY